MMFERLDDEKKKDRLYFSKVVKDYEDMKIVKSGHILEVYKYACRRGKKPVGVVLKEDSINELGEGLDYPDGLFCLTEQESVKVDRREENVRRSRHRSREAIRRLACANFSCDDTFLTLTFAKNEQDISIANNEFKKFMKRWGRALGRKVEYLAVIEFQDRFGRGAIHYHVLVNVKLGVGEMSGNEVKSEERRVAGIWGNGFVDLGNVYKVDNLGAYLVKYLTKNSEDLRLAGHKHYLCSRGLVKPEVVEGADRVAWLNTLEDYCPVFTSVYASEWHGEVRYQEYNLKRV